MGIQLTWVGALARRRPRSIRASHPRQAIADGADEVLTSLYYGHYRSLVGLARLLVHDVTTAEDITQAALAALCIQYRSLKDHAARMAFLRQVVVREARTGRRRLPPPISADPELNHLATLALLRSLPDRQREALVLRYYANLSEAETATAMGVTRGALRRHTARALTAARGNATICDRYHSHLVGSGEATAGAGADAGGTSKRAARTFLPTQP